MTTCNFDESKSKNEIVFCPILGEWAMKITSEWILFNRERYSNATPDDFAHAVIAILERAYHVEFKRK